VLRKDDTLETHGTGSFTQGYFGGITLAPPARAGVDAATGLIYVGNGQYYDPATGRFLTRDARPEQNNPYTPIDPTSALLGPLALLALAYGCQEITRQVGYAGYLARAGNRNNEKPARSQSPGWLAGKPTYAKSRKWGGAYSRRLRIGSGDWVSHKMRSRFMLDAASSIKNGSESAPISCVQAGGFCPWRWASNSTRAAEITRTFASPVCGRLSSLAGRPERTQS